MTPASRAEPEEYGYEPGRAPVRAASGAGGFYSTAAEADAADDAARNGGGGMPALTRRSY